MALPATAIDAQADAESGNQDYTPSGQPVVSPAGAMYAMQVMPNTAADPGFGVKPAQNNSPEEYDRVGRDYINALTEHYGDFPTALAAYNWGPGNVDKHGVQNAPPETKSYVQKIMSAVGNAIVPSAQAAEPAKDPSKMSDEELMTEMDRHGLIQQPDLGYVGNTPSITVRPPGVPVQMPDPSKMTDEDLMAAIKSQTAASQDNKATAAVASPDLATSVPATLTAYGANAVSQIPGLKEAGSALAAAAGAGQGNSFRERYGNLEDAQASMRKAGQKANPGPTDVAYVAGNVLGMGLGGGVANAAAPSALARFGSFAKNSPYLASMAAGAPMGALYGFANGTDADSRLSNAATTGGLSALLALPATAALRNVVSPLAGKLAEVGGNALGKIADRFNASPIMSGAGSPIPAAEAPVSETAADKAKNLIMEGVVQGDGIKSEDVADAMDRAKAMGLPARAIDVITKDVGGVPVSGRNAQGLLVASARMPGSGAQMAGELAARSPGLSDHVSDVLDNLLSKDGLYDVSDKALGDMETNAPPAYEKAFSHAPVTSPRIDEFMKSPEIQAGIKRGMKIQRIEAMAEGRPFDPNDYGISGYTEPKLAWGADGKQHVIEESEPIISGKPNMRLLDAGKKGLDAMINEEKNPLTGKMTEMGRALTKLKQSYVKELDAINPDYAAARQIYGDAASRLSSLRAGRNFLSMDPEEVQRFVNDPSKSKADIAAFASGARRALSDRFRENPSSVGRLWDDVIRPRLAPFAKPGALADADQRIELIQRMTKNGQLANMAGNSITMPAQKFSGKIEEEASSAPGKIAHAIIDPQSAAANGMKSLLDKGLQKRAAKMTSDVAGEVARYLTSDDSSLWRNLEASTKGPAQKAGSIAGVSGAGTAAATAQH